MLNKVKQEIGGRLVEHSATKYYARSANGELAEWSKAPHC